MQALMTIYLSLEEIENKSFGRLDSILKPVPIYEAFMKPIRGLGPKMSGVLISEINIEEATTVSKIWRYAGIDVGPDGRGRSRREEHLVDREYTKRDGTPGIRRGIVFNPFLKTKLYVMGTVFMKQGRRVYTPEQTEERKAIRTLMLTANPLKKKELKESLEAMVAEGPYGNKYGKIFDDYKSRLEHHDKYGVHRDAENIKNRAGIPKRDGTPSKYSPKLHRQNMAMRYMIKMFLLDLWREWRTIEGLSVCPPYAEAKLGMAPHHVSPQAIRDIAPGHDVFPAESTQEVEP